MLRFPLGALPKAKVRELAREFGLAIADKQDSQDICFVPTGRYSDIIARLRPDSAAPGDIVDLSGRVLGHHDGIIHFTVGQRKGLKIAAREPLHVVRLEADTRRVVVGPRAALATRMIHLHDVNWIGGGTVEDALAMRREVYVKVRSTREPRAAWLGFGRGGVEVELIDGEEGVAPGQACVFYDSADNEARVLGGGFIRATEAVSKVARPEAMAANG
jgi:tRNA-specific 2-thiouridylase